MIPGQFAVHGMVPGNVVSRLRIPPPFTIIFPKVSSQLTQMHPASRRIGYSVLRGRQCLRFLSSVGENWGDAFRRSFSTSASAQSCATSILLKRYGWGNKIKKLETVMVGFLIITFRSFLSALMAVSMMAMTFHLLPSEDWSTKLPLWSSVRNTRQAFQQIFFLRQRWRSYACKQDPAGKSSEKCFSTSASLSRILLSVASTKRWEDPESGIFVAGMTSSNNHQWSDGRIVSGGETVRGHQSRHFRPSIVPSGLTFPDRTKRWSCPPGRSDVSKITTGESSIESDQRSPSYAE